MSTPPQNDRPYDSIDRRTAERYNIGDMSISENVQFYLEKISAGNCFHEPVTLVAATKTRTADEINEAIAAGITDIGENKVQEFRDKYDLVKGGNRHFIGHLQTNKVKYLIGKTCLIHSLDRDELAEEIAKRSLRANLTTDVLIEVNIGSELSKSGYSLAEAYEAYERVRGMQGLRVCGFMAMLPLSQDRAFLARLADEMRALYDRARAQDGNIRFLSMGMSGDWELCLAHGANMIRLGTALFGARTYPAAQNA